MLDKKENKQTIKEKQQEDPKKEEVKEEPKKENSSVTPGHYDYSSNTFTQTEEEIQDIDNDSLDVVEEIDMEEINNIEQELNNDEQGLNNDDPFNWDAYHLKDDTPNKTIGG